MALKPGDPAPDFTLPSTIGDKVSVSDYRGKKNVILLFYPLDFSPVCSVENKQCAEMLRTKGAEDVQVLGISVDSLWAHKAFAAQNGVSYPLLADFHPKGEMAASFGAFVEKRGTTNRSLVLIGGDGVVGWSHKASAGEVPGANLIFDALAAAR
jgi:peroxiredoxin